MYSGNWTESTAHGFPICRAKLVTSSDKGIQDTLWPDLGPQTMSCTGPEFSLAALPEQES